MDRVVFFARKKEQCADRHGQDIGRLHIAIFAIKLSSCRRGFGRIDPRGEAGIRTVRRTVQPVLPAVQRVRPGSIPVATPYRSRPPCTRRGPLCRRSFLSSRSRSRGCSRSTAFQYRQHGVAECFHFSVPAEASSFFRRSYLFIWFGYSEFPRCQFFRRFSF